MKHAGVMLPAIFLPFLIYAQQGKPLPLKDSLKLPGDSSVPVMQKTLKGITVTARRPLLERDIDKIIVNVDAMISAAGSSALDVLEKTPGVTVDTDGSIGLDGKTGALVLIDGRPTYMSAPDLAAYLRSLPGGSLDKIELMRNPPARFDAAGTAVINLKLKKNKANGFSGNLSAGYDAGRSARSNNVVNANYRHGKINLFGNLGFNREGNTDKNTTERRFFNGNEEMVSAFQLQSVSNSWGNGFVGRMGADITASSRTTIGIIADGAIRPRKGSYQYTNTRYNETWTPDSIGTGETVADTKRKGWGLNMNFLHQFSKQGREISADLNYIDFYNEETQELTNSIGKSGSSAQPSEQFTYRIPSSSRVYTAKADYVHPLKGNAKWEAGVKSGLAENNNESGFFQRLQGSYVQDFSRSNHFIYREWIHAAYISARKSWKRWGAQAGLRAENTSSKGHQLGNSSVPDSVFNNHYTSVFPSAFLSYKLDSAGNHTITASASRRINRPNYQQFNPFLLYRDNYSYTTGNPALLPQFQTQVAAGYQFGKLLGLDFQYKRFNNIIFPVTRAEGEVFISGPGNVGKGTILSATVNTAFLPFKWWEVNGNFFFYHLKLRGEVDLNTLNTDLNGIRGSMMNRFTLGKTMAAELNMFYRGKDIPDQRISDPMYRMNIALQKKINNGKATLRLVADDVFHSWKQQSTMIGLGNTIVTQTNSPDTRRVSLGFSYRFGKSEFARKRKHANDAAEAEKGRME